jgi:transposase-like protein
VRELKKPIDSPRRANLEAGLLHLSSLIAGGHEGYLNSLIEQDHRSVKQRIEVMLRHAHIGAADLH